MDEIGQKKSNGWVLPVVILLAVLAIGAYMIKGKGTTEQAVTETEQVAPTTVDPNVPAELDEAGNPIVTDTKKLNIDRPTSASADIPTSYTSSDPAVVEMMKPRTLGSDSAPVKIIEYASLTCGHCGHFYNETLPAFKTQFIDTGKVQITYKEFPLNEPAVNASMILRCMPSDKYHDFMGKLFKEQEKWAYDPKYMDMLKGFAAEFGMDNAAFDACLANTELKKSIIGDMKAAAEKFKVQSTPSFVFGNGEKVLVGNQPMDIFADTIAKAEKGELSKVSENLTTAPVKAPVPEAAPAATPETAPPAAE